MTIRVFKKIFSLSLLLLIGCAPPKIVSQGCDPSSLIEQRVRAHDTDPNIAWELYRHISFYNPSCQSQNTLVVHLVGSFDKPASTSLFPKLAANNGFDVISLKYPNQIAAKNVCANSSDLDCYLNFRKEIIEGKDYSDNTSVDVTNSINNRLLKLLQYLAPNYPEQNWSKYFQGDNINWQQIIISGHSQGGGHAAVIAMTNKVKRVLMFAAPNDYSDYYHAPAAWTSLPHSTPNSAYFAFNNLNDKVVKPSQQFAIWQNLGLATFGQLVNVDNTKAPFANTHQLSTSYQTTGIGANHSAVILDSRTPLDKKMQPVFLQVWKYMLGLP